MSAWPAVGLGDVCEFRYGKSLPAESRRAGAVPVFGSNGRVGWHDVSLTSGPTIVVGRKGSFGEVAYSEAPCWPIDTTYYVDGTSTTADIRWLAYRLDRIGLTDLNRAAAVPGLNRDDAYRQQLLLPPLAEQRRIAAILDQADALRAKRREVIAHLDTLTSSVYVEMFGDPSLNPHGWTSRPLREVCSTINDCPHSTPNWTGDGEICLRTSNLTAGGWDWTDTRYVSIEDFAKRSARGVVSRGDIILSREGTVGVAAIVESGMHLCMGQRLVQVRADPIVVARQYLLRSLLILLSPERIGQSMVGSTSRHLNVKDLRALQVPIPPLALQQRFEDVMEERGVVATALNRQLPGLDTLFASVQDRAFKGGR